MCLYTGTDWIKLICQSERERGGGGGGGGGGRLTSNPKLSKRPSFKPGVGQNRFFCFLFLSQLVFRTLAVTHVQIFRQNKILSGLTVQKAHTHTQASAHTSI